MGKSIARKKREHVLRNEGKDVTKLRGGKVDFSMHERKTKTYRERKDHKLNKYKRVDYEENGNYNHSNKLYKHFYIM